jgi:hypothetical protein
MKLHKKMIVLRLLLLLCLFSFSAIAAPTDEGMWLPMFIKRLNYEDMKSKGLKLTPEEIYSVNNSSLKDAVVMLGGGFCTAEMVSKEGLVLTNHHCAYSLVQSHSSVEKDYISNGFWAMKKEDELPNEGLTASFLIEMQDVSDRIKAALKPEMSEAERSKTIENLKTTIVKEVIKDTHYEATVKDFFGGNEFYLFVYETFRDVRLVGSPPDAIGKFGGDTDNWMWTRHTGDFALLRIYADKDGKPANYNKENVPLKPRHAFPVSIKGIQKGDYAMIMGYPGSTDRYMSSYGVKWQTELYAPTVVSIRDTRLAIMKKQMNESDKYAYNTPPNTPE